MKQVYNVGIYCRLSVDDASTSAKAKSYIPAGESVSIENQRELLSKFVMLNGWVETRTYVDDGYSGGSFQRPGFLEMLEDARKGVINLILVKDLSRLGRDYVEVGRYRDVVFPSLGCRFVSVLDCLDSEGDNTDMLHFRSLMNDYHLRDLSGKIKSVLYSKRASGQYLAAYAPYGYQKSVEDKHKLVIDEYAADVVRRIYKQRLSGKSYGKITAWLNQEKILSPRCYREQTAGKDISKNESLWTERMVKLILCNEIYTGTILSNRTGTRSYKDRSKIIKPSSEWIRCEAAHEAVIHPDVWASVQKINTDAKCRAVRTYEPMEKVFSSKLICADCKAPMVANTETNHQKNGTVKRYVSYMCGRFSWSGRSMCSRHTIYEKSLSQIVLSEIKAHAQAVALNEVAVADRLKREIAGYDGQRLATAKEEIKKLRRRVLELETTIAKLYEDKYNGAISESTFAVLARKSEQERLAKTERLDELLSEVDTAELKTAAIQNWITVIRKYLDLQELDRTVVDELIDHIEIGERTVINGQRRQDIKVFYKFVGLVEDI